MLFLNAAIYGFRYRRISDTPYKEQVLYDLTDQHRWAAVLILVWPLTLPVALVMGATAAIFIAGYKLGEICYTNTKKS